MTREEKVQYWLDVVAEEDVKIAMKDLKEKLIEKGLEL